MNTQVSELLAFKGPSLYSTAPDVSVKQAVHIMNEKKIGCLLVVEDEEPVGIFSERDVLVRVVDSGANPETTRVREVMTTKLVTISPSTTVEEAMRIVTEKRCRHLPVLQDRKVLGMVSIGDLTRCLVREHENYIGNLLNYISGGHGS